MAKILVCTRQMNDELYNQSKSMFDVDWEFVSFKDKTAEGYLYEILTLKDVDWVINLDEDCFVFNKESILELFRYMIENKYVYCGVADGGVINHRFHNPLVVNPFFNIFHVAKIRQEFDIEKISKVRHEIKYEQFTPIHLIKKDHKFEYDNFEPFYPLFLWMIEKFKCLFLDANSYEDNISTILKDHLGNEFLIHTWYARMYHHGFQDHIERINKAIEYAKNRTK
jgi:hypothetical protein